MLATKCENCGASCWSGKGEYELCTKCQIGDQSPSLWLLNKIYKSLTKTPDKHNESLKIRNAYRSLTYNAKTGECVGSEVPRDGNRRDYVTISVSVECDNKPELPNVRMMIRRWLDGGTSALESLGPYQISNINNFVAEASQLYVVAISGLIDFVKEDMYFCSGCKSEKKNPPIGRHFAGTYCAPCWEQYKKKNSRICLKCRSELWQCYC